MSFIRSKGRDAFAQPMRPHRRQQIHGPIQPMAGEGNGVTLSGLLGLGVAATCLLYFAAQLVRPFL